MLAGLPPGAAGLWENSPSSMTISLLTGRQVFSHVIGHGQSAEICLIYPIVDLHDVDQLNDVIFGYQKGI